jgi:NAD(P)-dependent dehydrogenase (short-subunit alcohol dehydrogenase family)
MRKIIFITGATSGLGLVAACELAADGNTVIATARSSEKGNLLLDYYKTNYPGKSGKIEIELCDLSSFESIVNTCNTVKARYSQIDTLINNAGTWNSGIRESKDKIEETFQDNVLAPLLINHLLYSSLAKSADAKSIYTASALHQGYVDFNNLEFRNKFSGFKSYRQSKLEVILLCRLLAKKLEQSNIGVYSQHPGVVSTNLIRDGNWFLSMVFRLIGISPKKGSETLVYLARADKTQLVSGEYYALKAVKKTTPESNDMQVAQRLLDKLKTYLAKYIGSTSSPIFEK